MSGLLILCYKEELKGNSDLITCDSKFNLLFPKGVSEFFFTLRSKGVLTHDACPGKGGGHSPIWDI